MAPALSSLLLRRHETQAFGTLKADRPILTVLMERKATANVTLPDGTFIPKGAKTCMDVSYVRDETLYPEAAVFKPTRFMEKRDQGDQKAQYVSTSPEHLGFGHGRHACPGRFFASNEIKIAIIHMLSKYDWKFPPSGKLPEVCMEHQQWVPYEQEVLYRSRQNPLPNII
jgi:cytochrome P450